MTDSPRLPGSHYWPALPQPFWRWFQQVDASIAAGNTATLYLSALEDRVAVLESQSSLVGPYSVRLYGSTVQLEGDEAAPAASHYYGTDADGVRGWHPHDGLTHPQVMARVAIGF